MGKMAQTTKEADISKLDARKASLSCILSLEVSLLNILERRHDGERETDG